MKADSDGNMVSLVSIRATQALALITSLASVCLFAAEPDIEHYLSQNAPGNPMPDAFNGLNGSIPLFMVLLSGTSLLATRLTRKHQYVLFLPLLFWPTACFFGWCLTENFDDPSWFHLFAVTAIGMLVSCPVTAVLSILDNVQLSNNRPRSPDCSGTPPAPSKHLDPR